MISLQTVHRGPVDHTLDRFIADCRGVLGRTEDAAERVTEIAPLMLALLQSGTGFLARSTCTKIPTTTRATPFTSGVAATRRRCVSLHLYGRNMDSFHIYDVERGTRRMIDVPHYEAR